MLGSTLYGLMMARRNDMLLLLVGALFSCDGSLTMSGDPPVFAPPGTTPGNTIANADPGPDGERARPSLHRLNRLEYNNTVRDLLGTHLTPADDFPPDASIGGFDNVAQALSISPALMDRYFAAARTVVEDAFASRPAFQELFEENDPRLAYSVDRDANRIGGIVRLRGGGAQGTVTVPTAGPHTIVVRAQGVVNGTAAAPVMRMSVAGQDFDFGVALTMQDVSFALELQPGQHAVGFQALNFEENAAENRGNDILFDRFVLRSDALVEGPARTRVLVCDPVDANCAQTVVHTFARRAWRRPLTEAERGTLDGLYAGVVAEGEGVEDAIKLVLRAILTSPKFLYRYRMVDDSDSETLLDPYVMASRLSYFIWSTGPDDRLLSAAADGTLGSPDGIRQTVSWMLADARSSALANGFAEQWLDLRHLEQARPSSEVYPFSEAVRTAMALESKLFFLDYLDNGAPLASMLQPNFAYRDATLASHLGVNPPEGDGFERVSAAAGDRRGVLALSAWLTSRSDSLHSSPIRRGSWVADNMLCSPVPPPPAGLEIGELMEASSGLSVRERLELHRSDDNCAGCHANLDILGMGFEVFDGVGRVIADPNIDSVGELPGLGEFRGADEMAALMDPATFVACVSKKLFTYAIGRPLEYTDLQTFEALHGPAVLALTLSDLVTAIALSPAFSHPVPLE